MKNEIIKINDWTLTKIDETTEPMIADLELATRLGYKQPVTIKKIIKRMADAGQLGVLATVGNGETGARAGFSYYLTESQSLKVIARSKTDVADKILDEVIAVYLAYRRGQLTPAPNAEAIAKLIRETVQEEVRLALAPKSYPPLQLRAARDREPIEGTELDALIREFVSRFCTENPRRNTPVNELRDLFNNGAHWRDPRVEIGPFTDSMRRIFPNRVVTAGHCVLVGIELKRGL